MLKRILNVDLWGPAAILAAALLLMCSGCAGRQFSHSVTRPDGTVTQTTYANDSFDTKAGKIVFDVDGDKVHAEVEALDAQSKAFSAIEKAIDKIPAVK